VRAPPARTRAGLYQRLCRRRASGASGAHAGGTISTTVPTPSEWRLRRARGRDARAPGANLRCARLRRARGRDARAPGANLRYTRPRRGGLVGKPRRTISVSGIRTPKTPLLPVWEKGSQGQVFWGKPLRAISRFSHQDAQPPPSPRVGEGGRGDEGAHAPGNARASLPGTLIRGARASGAHAGGTSAHPAQTSGARALAGAGWLASPGVPSPVSGIRTPNLPLLPVWEKGVGGMRGHTRTGMPAHLSQERSP
jgi:hypothetical protein